EAIDLRARLAVAKRPAVLKLLALTGLALLGPFAANTYLGVLLGSALGVTGAPLAGVLMIFGLMGFGGSLFGGYGADHWPRERFIAVILAVLIAAFALLSIGPLWGGFWGGAALIIGLSLWGLFGWAFPITQQARLVSLDPPLAPITLSLNTSTLYLGAAIGSALGGFTIRQWSIGAVGWIAAASELAALAYLVTTDARLTFARSPRAERIPCPEEKPAEAAAA
ncbi:MAG TPA: hypothetical protein VKS78_08480, partial [Roseiarcus sp.]|nr:hypothetical protein [Roseiarcus sp.]